MLPGVAGLARLVVALLAVGALAGTSAYQHSHPAPVVPCQSQVDDQVFDFCRQAHQSGELDIAYTVFPSDAQLCRTAGAGGVVIAAGREVRC